jgi:hypothetical protein
MEVLKIVKELAGFSPRQFEREEITKNYILEKLNENGIKHKTQDFDVEAPVYEKYFLRADGKEIECVPTSFKGGKISKKSDIISSLDFEYECNGKCNINYNPYCDSISLANFYASPSFAISRRDVDKIRKAKEIEGFINIKIKKYSSCNILVGNAVKPRSIIFAHYDCFFDGVIDNASGVAVCMNMIIENPEVLKDNLFVFCGAEELSFDKPNYWGKCFGVFEKENESIMKKAERIIIVDCVGTDEPELKNDDETVSLFFAKNKNDKKKITIITSVEKNPNKFFKVYHSEKDAIGGVSEKYLQAAVNKCLSLMK